MKRISRTFDFCCIFSFLKRRKVSHRACLTLSMSFDWTTAEKSSKCRCREATVEWKTPFYQWHTDETLLLSIGWSIEELLWLRRREKAISIECLQILVPTFDERLCFFEWVQKSDDKDFLLLNEAKWNDLMRSYVYTRAKRWSIGLLVSCHRVSVFSCVK